MSGVLAYPAFVRFWIADAAAALGTFAATLALQLLVIESLDGDQLAVGVVRSAQWLPYLVVGLLAGVIVDRVRRRPVLVWGHGCCAALLGSIAGLALMGTLTVPVLAVLVFGIGTTIAFTAAAQQSLLPRLVPLALLPVASARIEQTLTVAQAVGPLVAGAVVRFASAPFAILVNAVAHLVAAATLATLRIEERAVPTGERRVGRDLREGARWVYRHPTLAPYAVSLHVWFLGNATISTVFVFHALRDLSLDELTIGLLLALAGVSGVLGAGLAPRAAERWGLGRVVVAAYWLTAGGWAVVLTVGATGAAAATAALLALSQLVLGLGMGLQGPLESSYRNAVTPDRLRARMNATIRSFNWGTLAVSAPLAGLLASAWGNREVIAVGVGVLVVAAAIITASPYRTVRMPTDDALG